MIRYILKRTGIAILSVFLIVSAIFVIMAYLPGTKMEFTAFRDGDALDRFYAAIGAGDHILTQLIRYFYNFFVYGSLAPVDRLSPPLLSLLLTRTRNSLSVAVPGFLFAALFGIGLGTLSALKQNRWPDKAISGASLLLASVPPFSLALLLVILLCLQLRLLPLFGLDDWRGYVMPVFVLGIGGAALAIRMTRSCVLEVLNKPFLTALRARGLRRNTILYIHVLKNAMIPILSVLNNTAI